MKNRGVIIIIVYVAVMVILLSFIPPVESLGTRVRFIIFHGIVSLTSLYAIYAAGILGALTILQKKESLGLWSREIGLNSVVLWIVGTILSVVAMQVAWGGLMWEPRTIVALTMVILGVGKEYLVRSNGGGLKLFAWANISFAVSVLIMRQMMVLFFHPDNPTGTSPSVLIRMMPWVMVAITGVAIIEFTRWRLSEAR